MKKNKNILKIIICTLIILLLTILCLKKQTFNIIIKDFQEKIYYSKKKVAVEVKKYSELYKNSETINPLVHKIFNKKLFKNNDILTKNTILSIRKDNLLKPTIINHIKIIEATTNKKKLLISLLNMNIINLEQINSFFNTKLPQIPKLSTCIWLLPITLPQTKSNTIKNVSIKRNNKILLYFISKKYISTTLLKDIQKKLQIQFIEEIQNETTYNVLSNMVLLKYHNILYSFNFSFIGNLNNHETNYNII